MADYKELLRRAISALPENNGAARRAVYEKARAALVGQLRAIQPPLPARDITQHRLQLEDCIRQVEQEASEAVISLGRDAGFASRPLASTASAPRIEPRPEPVMAPPQPEPAATHEEAEPEAEATPAIADGEAEAPTAPEIAEAAPKSIEDIIAEAAMVGGANVEHAAAPMIFAPARAASPSAPAVMPKSAVLTPRQEPVLDDNPAEAAPPAGTPAAEPVFTSVESPVEPALSSVREVDLEDEGAREAEGAMQRAIETLDREARGEPVETLPDPAASDGNGDEAVSGTDEAFTGPREGPRSGAGLTIFLVVFAVLLAGVGGAGFWAWREGYVDLDQMFGQAQPAVTETAQPGQAPATPTMDNGAGATNNTAEGRDASGPGNTATTTATEPTSALEGLESEERLEPTPTPTEANGQTNILPSIESSEPKTEERLSGADTSIAASEDPQNSVDPAVLAGNQSLLLEASADGRSGAVPFSGTVEWSEGTDEIGLPTLVAEASIPARNLGVSVTIRKNSDPSLPASHLMEITFDVPDTFVGGSISGLPGVLLKNEELVPGTPLAGASARVVGNSFLFALSASEEDKTSNQDLLESRRWLDLAVVYGTGRNAILTLEKDDEAQALFEKVFSAWQQNQG